MWPIDRVWSHGDPDGIKAATVTSSAAETQCTPGALYVIVSDVNFYYKWGKTGEVADSNDMLWPAFTPLVERAGKTDCYFQQIRQSSDGVIRMIEKKSEGV